MGVRAKSLGETNAKNPATDFSVNPTVKMVINKFKDTYNIYYRFWINESICNSHSALYSLESKFY